MTERIIDMNNPRQRVTFINLLRELRGSYRITIVKHRPRRSDRQLRYYWPCFVHEFGKYLRGQGEAYTDDQCHEMLKHKFLRQTFIDPHGEACDYTRSTSDLTTTEFNEYLDACAAWLSDVFGIVVPEPSEYHEAVAARGSGRVERGAGQHEQPTAAGATATDR